MVADGHRQNLNPEQWLRKPDAAGDIGFQEVDHQGAPAQSDHPDGHYPPTSGSGLCLHLEAMKSLAVHAGRAFSEALKYGYLICSNPYEGKPMTDGPAGTISRAG